MAIMDALQPFLWKQGQAVSPEEVARLRKIAEAAMGGTAPTTFGGGLNALGADIAGIVSGRRATEGENAGRAQAKRIYEALMGGQATPEEALGDPWIAADPGMSAVAQALAGRNDPLYKLKLAQAQLDYNQDQSGLGGDAETFFGTPIFTQDEAGNLSINQLGNQGSFNQVQMPEGQTLAPPTKEVDTGTEIITFDRFGNELFRTPKENYQEAYDTTSGSEQAKLDAELPARRSKAQAALDGLDIQQSVATQEIDRAIAEITANPWFTTGPGAQVTNWLSGTPGAQVAEYLKTIGANVGFDKLQAMRDASPTGGALGQVSDFENRQLQAVLGSLAQAQRSEDLLYNLRRLKDIMAEMKSMRVDAFSRDFSASPAADAPSGDDGFQPVPGFPGVEIKAGP